MSAAHRRFNGLRTHKSVDLYGDPFYLGSPCLYHAHSTKTGDAATMRSSTTHECLECSQSIEKGKFGLDVTRLALKNQRPALRFWSKVEIRDWDDCWDWTAKPIGNQLYHVWKRRELRNLFRHHPILVMMWVTWGDVGRLGSVSLCGQRRCCNPLHNLPLGLLDKVSFDDYDLQWLESERQILIDQVAEFVANPRKKANNQLESLKDLSELSGPELISPFEQAFNELQHSISDGTHSMFLK